MIDQLLELIGRERHGRGLNPLTQAGFEYADEAATPLRGMPTAGFAGEPHFGSSNPHGVEREPTLRIEDIVRMVSEIQSLMEGWSMDDEGQMNMSPNFKEDGGMRGKHPHPDPFPPRISKREMGLRPTENRLVPDNHNKQQTGFGKPYQYPQYVDYSDDEWLSQLVRRAPAPGGREVAPGNPYVHQSPYGF